MTITGLKINNHHDGTFTVSFTRDGVGQKHVKVSDAESRALIAFAFTEMEQPRERTAEERAALQTQH
jgi:hypothetical protein